MGARCFLGDLQNFAIEFMGKQMKRWMPAFFVFLSLSALGQNLGNYNWTPLPFHSSFIDLSRLSGDKVFGFRVVTMTTYDEISSAQMWGLSEISEMAIDCNKGTFQFLKTTWTERKMATGKVVKVFNMPQKNPGRIKDVLDGTFPRDIFKYLCQ